MVKIACLALLSVFILFSMIAFVACGGDTEEPAPSPSPSSVPAITDPEADAVVEITDDFSPKEVTIPVGGRVVWYNKGDRRWWVSSPTKVPDTGVIPIMQRMGYTFKEPGEYEYYDLYHKDIKEKVIVK